MVSDFVMHAQYNISQAIEELLLDSLNAIRGNTLMFAQVGANDGQMNDPLSSRVKRNDWSGILFEPVSSYFHKLVTFYGDSPRLTFVNGACGDKIDSLVFHEVLDAESLPHEWMRGLSSFRYDIIRKHFTSESDFNKYVRTTNVSIRPLDNYLSDFGVTSCDLLMVDTEGFELEVLRGFDASKYDTKLIIIEHEHLDVDKRRMCIDLMRRNGLNHAIGYFDIYFYREDVFGTDISRLLLPFADGICAHRAGF